MLWGTSSHKGDTKRPTKRMGLRIVSRDQNSLEGLVFTHCVVTIRKGVL